MTTAGSLIDLLLDRTLGEARRQRLRRLLVVHPALAGASGPQVSRPVLAQVMNMMLLDDVMQRVPAAAAYAEDRLAAAETIFHDHGAVRTVTLNGMGALPAGEEALIRILRPLGYRQMALYPLDRLKMTGRSYAQIDFPEDIGQFFVSELHPERFSPEFQAAVLRVTATSQDPLTPAAKGLLDQLEAEGTLDFDQAAALLPVLCACFDRQHTPPALSDYQILRAESAEMAWIATEGNAFNHATDRVSDVEAVAAAQKALGRPMKAAVETSASGRVRQTAYRAAEVTRPFINQAGEIVEQVVPGSFYEFITRLPLPGDQGRKLDLGFDSSNAQAIFKMTTAA